MRLLRTLSTTIKKKLFYGKTPYGLDFEKRLEEEGFKVDVTLTTQLASRDDIYRMGLPERGAVFFCRKIKQGGIPL